MNETTIIVSVVLGILTILGIVIYYAVKAVEYEKEMIYAAWLKLYKRTDISFEDWKILKDARLLPGQSDNSSCAGGELLTGVAIGSTINNH